MHAEIEGRDVTVMDHRSYEHLVTVYRLIIGTEVLKKSRLYGAHTWISGILSHAVARRQVHM
jgi:hypothetical protein